ncbi:MAG: VWA domain-containing protein, partial [Planctomycetes bacterium]|nr:VWA domain-containing protein [Planctomycetota bacterium]
MLGGDESFGLGGYYGTDVEKLLPVHVQPEMKKEKPTLAMMLLIDKSGSMTGLKMDLAKEAAIATAELLGPDDKVGVVAFDGAAYWIAPLQSGRDKFAIVDKISAIQAGGGTNMYPALEMAYEALSVAEAKLKHLIALTDGQTQSGDFKAIVARMASEKMTLSTVAIGQGADTNLLKQLADWSGGRYYFTEDAFAIPKIFTREAVMAAKSSLVEEPFMPHVVKPTEMTRGIRFDECPFLLGYVATKPKPTAEVSLISDRGEPVLAAWRVGLGKTAAFTSDVKARWASDWVTWREFPKFWAQVARSTMRKPTAAGFETSIAVEKGKARLTIDAVDPAGRYMNGLTTKVTVIKPGGESAEGEGRQIAPGRYEAVMPVDAVGTYVVRVVQSQG